MWPVPPIKMVLMDAIQKTLEYAVKYNCTIDMLYLKDYKSVMSSMDDMLGYTGDVLSCIDIVTKLCRKYTPVQTAKLLNKKYGLEMRHIHRCISVYLGELGTMDDEYIQVYADSNLSSLGTIVREYSGLVKDTMALASVVDDMNPHFTLDSFSVVYQLDRGHELDLNSRFNHADSRIDVMLQYDTVRSTFVTYNGNTQHIRRKVSTRIGKKIPKRYVEFSPKTMDKDGVIMAHWNGKDFKVYKDKFIFDCSGDDLGNVNKYVRQVVSVFGIDKSHIKFAYKSGTKASMFADVDNWNAVVLEDLILCDKNIRRIVSVSNGVIHDLDSMDEDMLNRNRSLVIYLTQPHVRCAFKHTKDSLKISITSLCTYDTAVVVCAAVVTKLLAKYRKHFKEVYEKYSLRVQKHKKQPQRIRVGSRIDALRDRLPELFANNYTRECHNLPIMLDTEQEADEYRRMGRVVIQYPSDGKYVRWYTSPSDDLFVGLKLNRLSNKHKFKYIITCYSSNHLENPSRETYTYYRGDDGSRKDIKSDLTTLRILSPGRKGPLPVALTVEHNLHGYSRLGVGGTFVGCLEHALEIKTDEMGMIMESMMDKGILNVVRQEVWTKTHDEILYDINDTDAIDGCKYYRLFEEMYDCNILLIEIGFRGKHTISIPPCKGIYIWDVRKCNKYVVIIKNVRKLYDDYMTSYELVVDSDGNALFDRDDALVSAIVTFKSARTIRSDMRDKHVIQQYINEYGKCNMVTTDRDETVKCNSRPMCRPCMDMDVVYTNSMIYTHLNETKTYTWLSTTSKYLYFPDNTSFADWFEST